MCFVNDWSTGPCSFLDSRPLLFCAVVSSVSLSYGCSGRAIQSTQKSYMVYNTYRSITTVSLYVALCSSAGMELSEPS